MRRQARKHRPTCRLSIERLERRDLLTGSIEGRVWNDADQDGKRESPQNGEFILSDISVILLSESGTSLRATTTNERGDYRFDTLPKGKYQLEFLPPAGTQFSPRDVGNNARDSDVDANGRTKIFKIGDGELQDNVDAGVFSTAPTGRSAALRPFPMLTHC